MNRCVSHLWTSLCIALACQNPLLAARTTIDGNRNLPWTQSYKAGGHDDKGQLVGGSEIMHIKQHAGRLFAFNGYWQDSHYPSTQSAQVVRLDCPTCAWQVDLDTGLRTGVTHMKGNILHEATFATDSNGKLLPHNVSLLVAASKADSSPDGGTAISVFVRHDNNQIGHYDKNISWSHETLFPGPGGGRKVPRDIVVYRDKVTGVDRIFLLCGQVGVLSGSYGRDKAAIVWDKAVEFPANNATLPTRPLGMAVANQRLYFSVGGHLYVREDGYHPSWSLAFTIPGGVNIEMGGIRGLTAIDTPGGHTVSSIDTQGGQTVTAIDTPAGKNVTTTDTSRGQNVTATDTPGGHQSLMLVWTPKGHDVGRVYRLDGPSLVPTVETTLKELYDTYQDNNVTGGGVSHGALGGYNRIFPVQHPENGATVHLIGFEISPCIHGNDTCTASVKNLWYNYYAGACYAVRTNASKYTTHEVNGRFTPGKPILESPRAFSMSPFPGEEHVLYMGGFDTNFHPATNMAWIFKAGLTTVLKLY